MTVADDLFREEAVRAHEKASVEGRLLRVAPRWTRWLDAVLVVALVASALAVSQIEVEVSTGRESLLHVLLRTLFR